MRTVIFPAKFENLEAIREFAAQAARDAGMDDSDTYSIELAMDEACTNIIEHAYEGKDGNDIECTCDSDDVCLTMVVRDHGKPFDPSTVSEPDLDADIEDRPVGGLGIFLIKQLMDEVHFEPLGESGNVLTLIKRKKKNQGREELDKNPQWREIFKTGEELIRAETLAKRRELIVDLACRLTAGTVELWLDESLFRLPGPTQDALFPKEPVGEPMEHAFKLGLPYLPRGPRTKVAYPLKTGGIVMGVLQVERPDQPFKKKEIETLEALTGHISLSLVASQRFSVEQWRIEQLTLVRRVSAQIANELNMDELTRRVTKLIQQTFNYYYVAVFTFQPGQEFLDFRSSAGQARGRGKPLKVRLGEGLIGAAAQAGQEIVTNDIHAEPRFRFVDVLPATLSEAVLPLKIEDQILGVLDIQSDQASSFHPNDLLVLRALADTISIAINGARLYGELQTRADHLGMVAEVSKSVTSTLDMDELLAAVADLIHDRLGFSYVHLFTVHPNRRTVVYEAGSGAISGSLKGYIFHLDDPNGLVSLVARSGEPMLVNDVSKEPRYQPSPFPPEDTRSEMVIPLLFDQQVVGVMDLQSDRLNAFTEDDRFLCEALADNVAAALHNADLYRTERWRRQVADSLREVAGSVSAEGGVDDVLERVLNELEHDLPCDVSAVWLLDGEDMYLAQVHGAEKMEVEAAFQRWPESRSLLVEALAQDQPLVRRPDGPMGPTGVAMGWSADYSSIAAALRSGDQPLGVITLSHHSGGRYGHEAQAVIATFASYAAVAIQNARLYDSAQEQAYASAALLQVAQAVANSASLEETIETVVRITPILVGVKGCVIYLWENERYRPAAAYGFEDEVQQFYTQSEFQPGDFPLLDTVRGDAKMVVGILDPTCAADCIDPELARTEEETFYAIQTGEALLVGFPLMIRSDLYGIMLVEEAKETRRFRQKRMEIVTSIAQQVALSLQNEHLQREMVNRERLEHEIQLARQIQKTFLPDHLPQVPGWDLAAAWLTARQVGGDFYDVFELPDDRLGLFIADVSDKGIPASIFMAVTRTLVRAAVYDNPSPAETLKQVNALILPDNKESMFVTAVYGVLSLKDGTFTYANAGHNPPILCRGHGRKFSLLYPTGAALGILADPRMEEKTVQLEPDDLVMLYTDGITEAFSPEDDIFGEERLVKLVRHNKHLTAQGLMDSVAAKVNEFMDGLPPADDLTMVIARRHEAEGEGKETNPDNNS